jgi:hypothetical protein
MRLAAAALCLASCLGAATPGLAKDTIFSCRSLAGVSFAHGARHANGLLSDDGLINREIFISLTDQKGFPLVRLTYRDQGGPITDARDAGAFVHASYPAAGNKRLMIVADYNFRREEYLLDIGRGSATLRLTRTKFVFNGWLSSVFLGECSVG